MEPQGLAPCTDALTCHPLPLRMPMRWPRGSLSALHVPPAQGVGDEAAGYLSKVWPLIPAISWAAFHATGDYRCIPLPLHVCSGVPRLTRLLAGAPKAHSSAALPPSGLRCESSGWPRCMACETSAGISLGAGTPPACQATPTLRRTVCHQDTQEHLQSSCVYTCHVGRGTSSASAPWTVWAAPTLRAPAVVDAPAIGWAPLCTGPPVYSAAAVKSGPRSPSKGQPRYAPRPDSLHPTACSPLHRLC